MQGDQSVLSKERSAKQAEVNKLHEKTFTGWLNTRLKNRNIKLQGNLKDELFDGIALIAIIEELSGQKCQQRYHTKPTLEIHKLENLTIGIEWLKTFGRFNARPLDFKEGNMKIILGLVWMMILRFGLTRAGIMSAEESTSAKGARDAKRKLLEWCQQQTKGHNHVDIQDLEKSWYDGMAFCALVHAFDPDAIDYNSLSPDNAKQNLTLAFDLAKKHLDIDPLLDPDDICSDNKPDEKCFVTYLSDFPIAFLNKKEQRDASRAQEEAARKLKEEEERKRREEEERLRRLEEEERLKREAAEHAQKLKELEEKARKQAEDDERRLKEEQERREREIAEAQKLAEEKAKEAAERARKEAETEAAERERRRKQQDDEEEAKRAKEQAERDAAMERELEELKRKNALLKAEIGRVKGKLIGKVYVVVKEAEIILDKERHRTYAVLFLERQKEKTRSVRGGLQPKWDTEFEFYVSDRDAALEVNIFEEHWLLSDKLIGKVTLPVSQMQDGVKTTTWHPLVPKKLKKKHEGKNLGQVSLEITYHLEK